MAKRDYKKQSKKTLIIVSIILAISIISNAYFIFNNDKEYFIPNQFTEGNKTYKQTLENYYDVEYEKTRTGIKLEISNPCLELSEATGKSMLPFFEKENLVIIDTCFPVDKLKVDDVIIFHTENNLKRTQHRITKINYKDKWVRTKGDNNHVEDDFKGFEFIYGKTIGTLNVLEDKKIVKEEIINETINLTFKVTDNGTFGSIFIVGVVLCSSKCALRYYPTEEMDYINDSFIRANDLTEENCKVCKS